MDTAGDGYSFIISIEDFDKTVLPPHARTPNTDEFATEVSRFYQGEFAAFRGRVEIVVDSGEIRVRWHSDPNEPSPALIIQRKLDRGEFLEAVPLLELLRRIQPDDIGVLQNLGMALSDSGQVEHAEHVLRHAVEVAPDHANAQVALGVALIRQGRNADAVPILRKAIALDPANPWAHRNLGGSLLALNEIAEAETALRRAVKLDATDQHGLFGLAQVLLKKGEFKEADDQFAAVIELDPRSSVAEAARQERTKLAEHSFKRGKPSVERPDAVSYCLDALRKFETVSNEEIQKVGFEIALLGQRGLDTNNPAQQYRLKNLPGQFSGLELVCLMYVAFKRVAPQQDIGFDLSKEFEAATAMYEQGH